VKLAIAIAFGACAHKSAAPAPSPISSADELVTAVVDDWSATKATLRTWHRDGNKWKPDGEPWAAVIGKTGAAWGDGLHGAGAPAGHTGPIKQEGDRKSPAGAFAFVEAFGYDAQTSPLPYRKVDASTLCIDDATSPRYGEIGQLAGGDFKSFEKMRRDDGLYELGIVVDHNHAHVRGHGSCIFLHVWAGPDSTTVGCTAMAKPDLARLVATVSPHATFVLLPRDEYRALSEPWGLPAQ
jgi:D-alanyl-D-alanine dipeptidase